MIQVQEQISLRRQCELLAVGRSGLYYEPVGTSAEELGLMRRIDEIHLQWPFYGSRKLCESLRNEGVQINRKVSVRRRPDLIYWARTAQFCGKSESTWSAGVESRRVRTSVRYASGSTSLATHVATTV